MAFCFAPAAALRSVNVVDSVVQTCEKEGCDAPVIPDKEAPGAMSGGVLNVPVEATAAVLCILSSIACWRACIPMAVILSMSLFSCVRQE